METEAMIAFRRFASLAGALEEAHRQLGVAVRAIDTLGADDAQAKATIAAMNATIGRTYSALRNAGIWAGAPEGS